MILDVPKELPYFIWRHTSTALAVKGCNRSVSITDGDEQAAATYFVSSTAFLSSSLETVTHFMKTRMLKARGDRHTRMPTMRRSEGRALQRV